MSEQDSATPATVADPRSARGARYCFVSLLTVAVCAVAAGASSFAAIADWLHDLDDLARARLGFVRTVPAATTIWRLLTRVDSDLLATALADWLRTRVPPPPQRPRRYRVVIAVDGKTMRGAHRPDGRQVHLLSALDTSTGIVLAQVSAYRWVCAGRYGQTYTIWGTRTEYAAPEISKNFFGEVRTFRLAAGASKERETVATGGPVRAVGHDASEVPRYQANPYRSREAARNGSGAVEV